MNKPAGQRMWDALDEREQEALASAAFEKTGWLIASDYHDLCPALSALGYLKPRGKRWALTPTGHNIRAHRLRLGGQVTRP